MTEEDGAATKPGGRARGGWAARIEQFGGVVRPVLYLRVETWTWSILEGVNMYFFLKKIVLDKVWVKHWEYKSSITFKLLSLQM